MLGLSPLPRTFAASMRDIESKRVETRRSAVVDLLRFAESSERPAVTKAIARLLEGDPDSEVRAAAALGSADAALTEVLPVLRVALHDRVPRVQQMALVAIGELAEAGDVATMEAVRPALESPLPALRYQALVAWNRLSPRGEIDVLIEALADSDAEVRWVSWTLIEGRVAHAVQVSSARGSEPTDEPDLDLAAIARRLRPHATDALPRNRLIAASVLHSLGDSGHLANLLESSGGSSKLGPAERRDLIDRCGRARFEPARPWLRRLAKRGWFEGSSGWAALVALANLGDADAIHEVIAELDAASARRRIRALEAVRDLRLTDARNKVYQMAQAASGTDARVISETVKALSGSGEGRD